MSTAADKKVAKSKSSDKEPKGIEIASSDVEILNFTNGKAVNIVRFKETVFNLCLKELGQVARVIRDSRRYIFPLKYQTQKVISLSMQVMTFMEPRKQLIFGKFPIVKML